MDALYVSNNCPGCVLVENALAGRRIQGLAVCNIDRDPNARAGLMSTGSRATPTLAIDGRIVIGAHPILGALRSKYGI